MQIDRTRLSRPPASITEAYAGLRREPARDLGATGPHNAVSAPPPASGSNVAGAWFRAFDPSTCAVAYSRCVATGSRAATDIRTRLLEATYRCIADKGLAATSLEDAARSAGVSRATLYRY